MVCSTLRRATLLLCAGAAAGFTPKDSAHCVSWSSSELPSPIPTEAKGGGAASESDSDSGALLCRLAGPRLHADDAADAAAGGSACAADERAAIGEASVHLQVGVLAADGSCVPLAQPAPHALASRRESTFALGGALQYARVHADCDAWWREVSQDVIPPIPELVLPFGGARCEMRTLTLE